MGIEADFRLERFKWEQRLISGQKDSNGNRGDYGIKRVKWEQNDKDKDRIVVDSFMELNREHAATKLSNTLTGKILAISKYTRVEIAISHFQILGMFQLETDSNLESHE